MNRILSNYLGKLFFKKWIIGIFRGNIEDIIRSKTFKPDISWILKRPADSFYADPFLLNSKDEYLRILCEEYPYVDDYGKLVLITLDKNFSEVSNKTILDSKSHLSYPFLYIENNKTYVFPESKKSGKLSCYEFDPVTESLSFVKDILDLPLLDSTILRYDNKYWIFGTLSESDKIYNLHLFYSDNLLGPYTPHSSNPVKTGLNGTRSAGDFIEVDGVIYRPSQNCKNEYGESMTICKITKLNKVDFAEEQYMDICIDKKNRHNHGMHTIHTINIKEDIIVVDGMLWTFSPISQLGKFIRNIIKRNPERPGAKMSDQYGLSL